MSIKDLARRVPLEARERGLRPELLLGRSPVAITDMTAGVVPQRSSLEGKSLDFFDRAQEDKIKRSYDALARSPFSFFPVVRNGRDTQEFLIVGRPLSADQVSVLIFASSPSKRFGIDVEDIITDYEALHDGTKKQKAREKRHAEMRGWKESQITMAPIVDELKNKFYTDPDNTEGGIVPVLWCRRDNDGSTQIVLDPLSKELQTAVAEALPYQISDVDRLNSGMGLMYLAAFSPWNTEWPISDSYRPSGPMQVMGQAQVMAYAYRRVAEQQQSPLSVPFRQDLQQSIVLAGLLDYAQTGELSFINLSLGWDGGTAEERMVKRRTNELATAFNARPRTLGGYPVAVSEFIDGRYIEVSNSSHYSVNPIPGTNQAEITSELRGTGKNGLEITVVTDRVRETFFLPYNLEMAPGDFTTGVMYRRPEQGYVVTEVPSSEGEEVVDLAQRAVAMGNV